MHSKKEYKFNSEADAQKFADAENQSYDPSCDVYITGPFFVDESNTFKDMPWVTDTKTYWHVGVEVYR
jgi:hypothetical protein|tara:strand:+ start:352 stop:555 length:204 start_codon:yes stop_codon:yes gene_type:complete